MAIRILSEHAGIYGMGIYAIMLPSSGFSVAHWAINLLGTPALYRVLLPAFLNRYPP